MKKFLLSIGVIITSLSVYSQADTLTSFFTGTPNLYLSSPASGGGYVTGNNGYEDKAKMQLFDNAYGVQASGTINKLLLWAPVKSGTGTFRAVIWSNVAGEPGAELGSATVNISSVDTTIAGVMPVSNNAGYNVSVTFSTPIAIPSNKAFWAGIVLPTSTGDTIALVSNTDGDFTAGGTHTGEFWSDDSFNTFGDPNNWGLDIALAIFPVVTYTVGLEEENNEVSVYPNPVNDVLNFKLNAAISSVAIYNLDGKLISKENVNSNFYNVSLENLEAGVYLYELITSNGTTIKNNFVKN